MQFAYAQTLSKLKARRNGAPFWEINAEYQDRFGVYVFAIKAGRGYTPIYIGKATKTFKQECFTSDKVSRHYSECLGTWAKGKPVMFFLVTDTRRGEMTKLSIAELEKAPAVATEFKRAMGLKPVPSVAAA